MRKNKFKSIFFYNLKLRSFHWIVFHTEHFFSYSSILWQDFSIFPFRIWNKLQLRRLSIRKQNRTVK